MSRLANPDKSPKLTVQPIGCERWVGLRLRSDRRAIAVFMGLLDHQKDTFEKSATHSKGTFVSDDDANRPQNDR